MDPSLILREVPPLDPDWLAHEQESGLLSKPYITDIKVHKASYIQRCKSLNDLLLSGRDKHLGHGITIHDFQIKDADHSYAIPCRYYAPSPQGQQETDGRPTVIYYHGGGLYVGDLDSEDLTCRRISKELQCTVYSCDYRLMPEFTADNALSDAIRAFQYLAKTRKGPFILMGSSSGGQLAAQASQACLKSFQQGKGGGEVCGVLLRGPVTCDATDGGINIPSRFKEYHTSMSPTFHTSILTGSAVNALNRTTAELPLEAQDFNGLPRHWIQVSTNDIYYSDGACYAQALRQADVEVRLDVVVGWPHTFWLKAPYLERAVQAERDMIEGLRWLLEGDAKKGGI